MAAAAIPYVMAGITAASAIDQSRRASKAAKRQMAPTPMPIVDEAAMATERRKQIMAMQARTGRQSTMLTGGDKLGG
jgi:hypothetical protein